MTGRNQLRDAVLSGGLEAETDGLVVRHRDVLRALLVPSGQRLGIQPGVPAVGDINVPGGVADGGHSGGDVLVVTNDFLLLGTAAVGVEGRSLGVGAASNVVVKDAATLGAADCEV